MVDPDTLEVVAHMPVGPAQHKIGASAVGRRAYVSNIGYGLAR